MDRLKKSSALVDSHKATSVGTAQNSPRKGNGPVVDTNTTSDGLSTEILDISEPDSVTVEKIKNIQRLEVLAKAPSNLEGADIVTQVIEDRTIAQTPNLSDPVDYTRPAAPPVTRNKGSVSVKDRIRSPQALNGEPIWVAQLRAKVIDYLTRNPLKVVESFKDIGLDKPKDVAIDNIWLAMFKIVRPKEKKASRRYQCYACGLLKVYKRQDRARDHWKTHVDHKPVGCERKCGKDQCKERFISKEAMKAHVYRAKVERKTCPHCEADFEGRNSKKHIQKCSKKSTKVDYSQTGHKRRKIAKDVTAEIAHAQVDTEMPDA